MDSITKAFGFIMVFTLAINLFIGMFLVSYVAVHDYAGVGLIELGETFVNNSMMNSNVVTQMESLMTSFETLPSYIDKLFLLGLISFAVSLMYSAYNTPRIGYMSLFGLLTIGVIFFLFGFSYWLQASTWVKNTLFNLVPTLSPSLPFFNWYMSNAGVIGMVLGLICILLCFIDLDLQRFNTRKDKEITNDEI